MKYNFTYTTLTQQTTLEQLLERQEMVGVRPYVSWAKKQRNKKTNLYKKPRPKKSGFFIYTWIIKWVT